MTVGCKPTRRASPVNAAPVGRQLPRHARGAAALHGNSSKPSSLLKESWTMDAHPTSPVGQSPCLGSPGFVVGKRREEPSSPATVARPPVYLLSLHNPVARAARALAGSDATHALCERGDRPNLSRARAARYTGLATRLRASTIF